MKDLLFLSSDDRRRYAEDIQTVLALPRGAIIQFRYRERWVTPTLQRAVATHQVEGLPAVLGFVSGASTRDPFVLPVRHATVAKAELIADMFVFKLRAGGYANLEQYPRSWNEIVSTSRGIVSRLKMNESGTFYPATSSHPVMPEEVMDDVPERWLAAARRLAVHPTFRDSYFLRVAPVETQGRTELSFDSNGRITAVDGESLRITTHIFAENYAPDAEYKLTCCTDGTNLRVASDDVYNVALRYDTVEFWLHPAAQNFDTFSRVTISLASEKQGATTIAANVRLPLIVSRSRPRMFRRWSAASTGAVLVALPSMLGNDSPLQVRIAAALVGAGLLATGTLVKSSK
jgi:hypothetical protein